MLSAHPASQATIPVTAFFWYRGSLNQRSLASERLMFGIASAETHGDCKDTR